MTDLQNRLNESTSPYLLQHKDNPVHWQLWGDEAFALSEQTGKPILLSIGYAACHWCHVMAHESFENPETAKVMNELFINIKLDREERPDLDHFYMTALQLMGEQGGWPMTMFLDSQGLPFFGGTYFPPEPRYGRTSFTDIMQSVAQAYTNEPEALSEYSEKIKAHLSHNNMAKADPDVLDGDLLKTSLPLLRNIWDHQGGGMSGAPKFPQAPLLSLLSHIADKSSYDGDEATARQMLDTTLTRMGNGGIYDHIGGGFARYSVDDKWFVPHFEKMLYDNALLLSVYVDGYRATKNPLYEARIHETITWLVRDMLLPEGAYASALDADSEGLEGLYYLWKKDEVQKILGDDTDAFCSLYNITESGNWVEHGKGYNIPHLMQANGLGNMDEQCQKLLQARINKIPPAQDDKILTDWNAFLISALTKAAILFNRKDYFEAAVKALDYISNDMVKNEKGELYHCSHQGKFAHDGILSDYAASIIASLDVLSGSGFFASVKLPDNILTRIQQWNEIIKTNFWDATTNQFYMSSSTSKVPVKMNEWQDNATPSSTGLACIAYAEIFHLFADVEAYDTVMACLQQNATAMMQSGFATASLIQANEKLHNQTQILATGQVDFEELATLSSNKFRYFIINENNAKHFPKYMQEALADDKSKSLYRICDKGSCRSPIPKLSALGIL